MKDNNDRYAGFWTRLLAHNIDLVPILLLFYGVSLLVPPSNYDYLLIAISYLAYHILFEASMQATPGKKWARIKITNSDGGHPTIYQTIMRNLSKFLSLLLFFGGFVLIVFDPKHRALHDYIGSTLVLFDED